MIDKSIESADRGPDVPIHDFGAVVLCGGKSSRMGVLKPQLWFDNQTFLQRVVDRVGRVASPVVCVTVADQRSQIEFPPGVLVCTDEFPDLGPLEGIRIGLSKLAEFTSHAFVTSCDTPNLEPELIRRLAEPMQEYDAIMPICGERIYGMTAVYRTDLHTKLAPLLRDGSRRVSGIQALARTLTIPLEELRAVDSQLDSFTNINTPEDYFAMLDRYKLECPAKLKRKFSLR